MTALYVPGTDESDHKKQNMSLQLIGSATTTNTTNITANTASIVTNTTNIATNTANIATNTASIAQHEAAWTAYTPTLTALAGTYTTSSAAGRYLAIGKTVHIHVTLTITTVGTGTYPVFTLPVTARDFNQTNFYGVERGVAFKVCIVRYANSGALMLATFYDNSIPAASGAILELTGVYEAA